MSLSLSRSDLIASESRADRIPTCSGGAGTMSPDAVCGQAPISASAGRFAGQQMQTSKIVNRSGWSDTADLTSPVRGLIVPHTHPLHVNRTSFLAIVFGHRVAASMVVSAAPGADRRFTGLHKFVGCRG